MGRKRIPQKGIFWQSVIAKTNQDVDFDPRRHEASTGPPTIQQVDGVGAVPRCKGCGR
jgi:hypothetical protein